MIVFAALSGLAVAATLVLTWLRLFKGMDLLDESYYVLVPWRWALGDKPFVQEQNLAQIPGFVMYPFVKLFAVLRDYDVTGYVLYMRHLYYLMMLGVAASVFALLRRLVRWELAALAAAVYVGYIFWATPQLSYNTIALAFLTLAASLGAWVVLFGKGGRYAFLSGAALGIAVAAYPSLLCVVPFWAVFLAFSLGRRSVAVIAQVPLGPPLESESPPTGRAAWNALGAWTLGGLVVLVPIGIVMLTSGLSNILRSWEFTMTGARVLHQLGGAAKALDVAQGFWRLLTGDPVLLIAALLVYLVYRRYPRVGRGLLAALPVAFWLTSLRPLMAASGYVQIYALIAPYLFLFIPRAKRHLGARLLILIWGPAMIAGAMTAYTSAAGYVNASVGFAPAMMVSGLFLAWSLEAVVRESGPDASSEGAAAGSAEAGHGGRSEVDPRGGLPWLALVVLIAVLAVPVAAQFRFQQRAVAYGDLTSRFDSGPWWGIQVTPERRQLLDAFGSDLDRHSARGDKLLVFYEGCGFYLYWRGAIAANTYWMSADPETGGLPRSTISYYRRHRVVPTLAVHLMSTAGMTTEELTAASGGLDYPPELVRPMYAFQRKPPGETTEEVLARLPRE